jgi:RHS repeat-associated protein
MSPVYSAYGECVTSGQPARSAYAGERAEADTGEYILGSRLYSPVLRRFLNPDALSPFEGGGLNRYAYCGGDPVNRVDPDGKTWWSWPDAGQQPLPGVAGGRLATVSTPDAAALSGAPVRDAGTVAAEIGVVAADDLFGALAAGSGAASTGSASRYRTPAHYSRWVGRKLGERDVNASRYSIDVVSADDAPFERFRYSRRRNALRVTTHWIQRRDPLDERITHWGPDTAVSSPQLPSPLRRIGHLPVVNGNNMVYLYTGVHGYVNGNNWADNVRQKPNRKYYRRDRRDRRRYAGLLPGRQLKVEDISGITTQQMIDKMSRPGVHLHAYCFGAVDNLMLDILGADPVPVYLPYFEAAAAV